MSTKVGKWNISYKHKKGQMIMRRVLIAKYDLDMSELPEHPADRHNEVVRRLQAIQHFDERPFDDVDFAWVTRLAEAVIKEAGVK